MEEKRVADVAPDRADIDKSGIGSLNTRKLEIEED